MNWYKKISRRYCWRIFDRRKTQLKLTWIRLKSILGDLKFDPAMLEVEFILTLPLPPLPYPTKFIFLPQIDETHLIPIPVNPHWIRAKTGHQHKTQTLFNPIPVSVKIALIYGFLFFEKAAMSEITWLLFL